MGITQSLIHVLHYRPQLTSDNCHGPSKSQTHFASPRMHRHHPVTRCITTLALVLKPPQMPTFTASQLIVAH